MAPAEAADCGSRRGGNLPLPNKGFRETALRATLEEALMASGRSGDERSRVGNV